MHSRYKFALFPLIRQFHYCVDARVIRDNYHLFHVQERNVTQKYMANILTHPIGQIEYVSLHSTRFRANIFLYIFQYTAPSQNNAFQLNFPVFIVLFSSNV